MGVHPKTFELQGSNDGSQWTTLCKHDCESWAATSGCAKAWPVKAGTAYFCIFRILNQGPPHSAHISPDGLVCAGIEFYGSLKLSPPGIASMQAIPTMAPTLISTTSIDGWWCCVLCVGPCCCSAFFHKEATGPSSLKHRICCGCCYGLPCPCCGPWLPSEHRTRIKDTNAFQKD